MLTYIGANQYTHDGELAPLCSSHTYPLMSVRRPCDPTTSLCCSPLRPTGDHAGLFFGLSGSQIVFRTLLKARHETYQLQEGAKGSWSIRAETCGSFPNA